jgi:hypothetical protein
MSRIEDLLREAAQENNASIQPGALRGLDLSQVRYDGRKRAFRAGRGLSGIRVRRDLALPALAAVVVVVMVALSLALAGVLRAHSGGGSGPAVGQGTGPSGVPRYYVTGSGPQPYLGGGVPSSHTPVSAEVVDSRTGTVVAVVKPPPGVASFAAFGSGSSDDRTFVIAAEQKLEGGLAGLLRNRLTFFVLRFDPATRQATLQQLPALPGRLITNGNVTGIAVSPDGSRVAVSAVGPESASKVDAETFAVSAITLSPGGTWRTWQSAFSSGPIWMATQPVYDSGEVTALSWTPGSRVLALGIPQEAVLLDTTRPAGDLLKAGRPVVFPIRLAVSRAKGNAFQCDSPPSLSGDGTALVCFGLLADGVYPDREVPLGVAKAGANAIGRFSAATGKLLSLTVLPGSYADARSGGPGLGGVMWSSLAGDVLVTGRTNGPPYVIVGNKVHVNGTKQRTTMIVVSHGVAKTIPEPAWAVTSPNFYPGFLGVGW